MVRAKLRVIHVPAMVESGRQAHYPHLMGILDTGYDSSSDNRFDNRSEDSFEDSFEFGLRLVLDGIERRIEGHLA